MGTLLGILGMILAVAGSIWLLILVFQDSVLWGVVCIVLPIAQLLYVVQHWEETKSPFLLQLGGAILLGIGRGMSGS